MRIEDLFAKKERLLALALLYLRQSKNPVSLKTLSQGLKVSKATLVRYLSSFREDIEAYQLGISLELSEDEVRYDREMQLSEKALLAYFCQSSIKYQILVTLFEEGRFSIQQLSQSFFVSEATLNRHLAQLNRLLSDFEISIRQGQLRGDELQIRYFYYCLFGQLKELDDLKGEQPFKSCFLLLPIFERFYETSLSSYQLTQLVLWLGISQKRWRAVEVDFSALERKMSFYSQHRLYQKLRGLLVTFSQQQSLRLREGDSLAMFAFLVSDFMLPPHHLEQLMGFSGPLMEAASWAFQTLRKDVGAGFTLQEDGLYYLNQLLNHIYFFKGQVVYALDEELLASPYDGCAAHLSEGVIGIYQTYVSLVSFDTTYMMSKIQLLYDYVHQLRPQRVEIAFVSCQPKIVARLLLERLRAHLANHYTVLIDWQIDNKDYDLVISDGIYQKDEHSYMLHGDLYEQDIAFLKAWIERVRKDKTASSPLSLSLKPQRDFER
ncbi:helix-turn-helix domain-containing protein [Streptococcus sp. zg-JUN1979]|uniref:helix-turn-helix domain-containing protein n=1 Tax=Streptococcus sp. zg-JUN1979 TaxID=3391450 RepID=UPI0039A4E717